jgi:hypothetical protein
LGPVTASPRDGAIGEVRKNGLEACRPATSSHIGWEDKRRPQIDGRKRVFSAPARGIAGTGSK